MSGHLDGAGHTAFPRNGAQAMIGWPGAGQNGIIPYRDMSLLDSG